jgi:hypothetical protein
MLKYQSFIHYLWIAGQRFYLARENADDKIQADISLTTALAITPFKTDWGVLEAFLMRS